MGTNDKDKAEEPDKGDDIHKEISKLGPLISKTEPILAVVQHDVVLYEQGLAQDNSIIKGFLDVQDHFLI